MAKVYVSIGSNIDRDVYINNALTSLQTNFGHLVISSVYESEAVGFTGDNFYNLVAGLETELSVGDLSTLLKNIEDQNDRCRKGPRFSGRTLDIDILTYDQLTGDHDGVQLPRDEITKNAFVLWPLAEIAGQDLHPVSLISYEQLWADYEKDSQQLWSVEYIWQGHSLPADV